MRAADELVRHDVREVQARNAASSGGDPALLEVGALRTRLLLASDVTQAYACVPLAHVVECRADKQVVLDENFIPTVLHVRAADRLAAFTSELLGLLHQRGEALAGRVAATGRGAAAEFADFLMLQAINRYEPLLAHYADSGDLHPESLFQVCVSAAGELATFTATSKRPPKVPAYRHDRLRESFDPVIAALRESLSKVLMQSAISIPIEPRKFGISVAIVERSVAVRHGGLHSGGARRPAFGRAAAPVPGAAQDRSGGEDQRSGAAAAARRAGAARARRAAADPVSRRVRVFRARSNRRPVGAAQELGWDCHARRGRVPGAGAGVLGDPQLIRG